MNWLEPEPHWDGETECPACGVVICGFCQGTDLSHGCKGSHLHDCPYIAPSKFDRPGLTRREE